MIYKQKKNCRCCFSNNLYTYIDLSNQPLANDYHKNKKLKKIPLKVAVCTNCFHSQLTVVVQPASMFKNYLYVSGTTKTFQNHTKNLALDVVKRFKNKNKLKVLDVACNDGTQLEHFKNLKCNVYGVDPAENLRKITKSKKIPVEVAYWNKKTADKYNFKFNIITATNVFAHVDDIYDFLSTSAYALSDDGLIIIEFPYGVNMISNNEFDTIYHEHLSYFLVSSFKTLVKKSKLKIVDLKRTQIHGGSIRFYLSKTGKTTQKVYQLVNREKEKGLYSINTYNKFNKNVNYNKVKMNALVENLKLKNKKVIGYGASAKGNTMLNYFKLNLEYIVDDNELKWGYKTPGRNIKIKSPEVLRKEKEELYIVILSWNFYNEISKNISLLRGNKYNDKAIVYIPKVKMRNIKLRAKYNYSA